MYKYQSLMVCIEGTALTDVEIKRLLHPLTAGVILFSRNFVNSQQLRQLTQQIKSLKNGRLIIAVDNEGGRVQRFKTDEFTHIPAMKKLATLAAQDESICLEDIGYLLAAECKLHGIDVTFAPVLDIDNGSDVVGDRAFSQDKHGVVELSEQFIKGLKKAQMPAIGKHFPGHGSTKEDSHFHTPVDNRSKTEIIQNDGLCFEKAVQKNLLDGIMPAHILFPQVDDNPVGYSSVWLKDILQGGLAFEGIIFSDDLAMVGAGLSVDNPINFKTRYQKAISAGCDIALICNKPHEVDTLLSGINKNDEFLPNPKVALFIDQLSQTSNFDLNLLQRTRKSILALNT